MRIQAGSDVLKITDRTTAKYVQSESPWDPVDRTTTFSISDRKVYSWFEVDANDERIYDAHNYKWVFTSPDRSIKKAMSSSTSSNSAGFTWIRAHKFLDLESIDAINNTGIWHVDFYIDGKYYASDGFKLTA